MSESKPDSRQSILQLLDCIQQLASNDSNPVFEVLGKQQEFQYETKYPEKLLTFGGANVKAYYHAHSGKYKNKNEHGHFHIFIKDPDRNAKDWTHVAGLSMDNFGQPQQWFTVNHWVTGGIWEDSATILKLLNQLDIKPEITLVESWIVFMIFVYLNEINELLNTRDKILDQHMISVKARDVLDDHNIYYLSKRQINLQNKIESSIE